MYKKVFSILLAVFFIAIAGFHFTLNFSKRAEPPSYKWAKEVLISSGNLQSNPSLIKFKDNYIVVHSDSDKIKVISIDNNGKKLKEKTLNVNAPEPLSTSVVTDGKEIIVYWTIIEEGKRNVYSQRLDERLNALQQSRIDGTMEIASIGDNISAFSYIDKVIVEDFNTGKSFSVQANEPQLISGAKNKNSYVLSFKEKGGKVKYFDITNDKVSKVKTAGEVPEVTSIVYTGASLTVDEDFAYLMIEYRNKGEFGETKLMRFSLKEEGNFELDDFKVNNSKVGLSNVVTYANKEGEAKFLAIKSVPYDKKDSYKNIVEYNFTNPTGFVNVSRTKELSMYPAAVDDVAVFCDVVGKDKFNVYMTSSSEQFIKTHNNLRNSEIKLALMDTISGILFSFAYILPYGALWVLPSIGVIFLYSIFEFKLSPIKKKRGFAIVYIAYFIFKVAGVKLISFERFAHYLPEFMTFGLSFVISLIISLLCGVYAYLKYSSGIEDNVGATSLFIPIVWDTVLSLMFVVPFIV